MTETNKTISGASGEQPAAEKRKTAAKSASSKASATQKNGPAKTAAAKPPQRDAYDDFLDEMDRAEKAAGTQSRAASSKKTGAAKSPAASPRKAASGKQAAVASKKTDSAKKQAPSSKKVAYQDDLLAAWDELERESRLRKDTRRAAARSTGHTAPRGKRSAAGSSADSPRPRAAAGTPRKRPADKNPGAPGNRSSAAKARRAPARQAVLLVDNDRDAYDDFLEETDGKHARKRPFKRGDALTVALLAAILCIIGLGGWQFTRYQKFMTMKAAVDRQTFYDGTTVEGVDVSGMTLEQANRHWAENIEPTYSQRAVTLSNGATFTAAELGYSSDYEMVLSNAWSAGRSGSLVERYEALSDRAGQMVNYTVTRSAYNRDVLKQCVSAIAQQIDRPAEDSKIGSFDVTSYTFQFTDEVIGSQLDQERLFTDMTNALNAGGGTVELVVNSIQPAVKKADIASQYGMIASAVTNASSSSSNRLSNIKLALQFINGTCLAPGETFSFNGTVGERTTARGFKAATAYSSGKVVEEVGGGICQVSTTLFNAAVKSDMKIVERHNHSLTVGYVDLGKDAAVNWDSQDLRFTNTSSDNVYICCYLTSDKRVRFGIFGKLLPNGESITVEGVTTGRVDYQTVYQPSMTLASGETKVAQSGKQGYTAEAYKIRWDANGNQISKELLCKSTYRSTDEIIEYGP